MKHNIIQHTSFWDDKKHLPFDTRLLTLLLLTACGGGGSGGDRSIEVSLASVRVSRTGNEVEGTGQNDFIYVQRHSGRPDIKVTAGDGDDVVQGNVSNDELIGGLGDHYLIGQFGNDKLYGNDGNDVIWGQSGNDELFGGNGNDHLYGNNGNDTLHGNAGQDYFSGGDGNDELEGGEGNDYLDGGAGNDILKGGVGNDYIDGGAGMDTLTGSAGVDIFAFDYDEVSLVADIITDFEVGIDRLEFVEGFETDERYFDIVQSDGNTSIYYTQSGQREIIVTLEGVTDGVSFDDFLFYYAEVA